MATIITRETGATAVNRTLTNAELDNNFINLNADIATRIPSSEKAAANGVATLDATGKVPSTQLPSYVDDVLEAANLAAFPATGETGKIYVALDTNKAYRWSGSTYIYITSGAVDSVAGRTGAVVLTKTDVGLSSVDNTADADKNVLTATKWATARTVSITGDISGSASVDGSANATITATLPATGVTAGNYGSATAIPVITVDAKGRLTLVSTVAVSIPSGSISVTGGDFSMSGSTGSPITNATLATVNSNVGTFNTVTVNAKGLVTSASNVNYLTSYTETDTLATVTARGASTSVASTFSGGLTVAGTTSSSVPVIAINPTGSGAWQRGVRMLNSGMTAGDSLMYAVGQADSNKNMGQFYFYYAGAASTSNRLSMGLHSVDDVFNIFGSGNIMIGTTTDSGHKLNISGTLNATGTITQNGTAVALAGHTHSYLTSESDTLATVTARGASTSTASTFSGGLYSRKSQTAGNYTTAALWTESYDNTATGIAFHISGVVGKFLEMRTNGTLYWNSDTVWHSGNDGSGSGLDADLLDGQHGSYYYSSGNPPPYPAEADTLATVTARGASTSTTSYFNSKVYVGGATVSTGYNGLFATNQVGAASGNKLIYFYNDGSNIKMDAYDYGAGSAMNIQIGGNGGYTTISTSTRSPIFYDSEDTTYYGDFNNGGVRAWRNSGYSGGISVADTGGYLTYRITTNNHADGWGWQFTTNDITSGSGTKSFWVTYAGNNAYAAGSMRAPIFYDSDNTAYYADPAASTSFWGAGSVGATNGRLVLRDDSIENWATASDSAGVAVNYYGYNAGNSYYRDFSVFDGKGGLRFKTYGSDNYAYAPGSFRAPIFYDSDNTGTYINPNGSSVISSGGSYPMEFRSTQRYISRFWNTSATGYGWWLANDSYTLVFHADSSGDKASLNTDGVFIATGSIRSPVFYDSNDTSYYLDPASTSQLNVVLLDGQGINRALGKAHSGSDFPNGTLVITNINASVTNGDSFVLECTGKSYSTNPPFSFMAQGYIYADSFINCSGIHHGWAGFSTMKVLNYNGNLAFWWPRVSYWNSFEVRVRDAGGSVANRVTNIIDSTEPSSSKKVSISMYTTHIAGMNANSGPIYASIFYDSDNTGYYVDPASTSSCNTIGAVNFRTYNAFYLGDNNYYFNNTNSGWYSNVKVQSAADMRAPVFYDIDNTGYYVDPTGTTSLRTTGDWRADSTAWTGEFSGKIQYHGSNWYFQAASDWIWRNSGGSNVVYANQSGDLQAVSSMRSPIFYDQNDTGYYIDPNSTSNTALRMRGGALFGPNPTWGAYLYVGTDGRAGTNATVAVTNGNLHIDAQDGYDIYLNHYNGRWTRSNGFYDNQDTAYYLDANSTSRMYRIDFNNLYYAPDTSYGFIGTSIYVDTINSGYSTDPLEINYVRGSWAGISHDSLRAPIFYDYNDTGYYTDPNSSSRLYQTVTNISYLGADTNKGYAQGYGTYSTQLHKIARITFDWDSNYNTENHGIFSTNINGSYSDNMSINSYNDINLRIDSNDNDAASYVRFHMHTTGNNQFAYIGYDGGSYLAYFAGSTRSPIFYDSDDTGYYINPNSYSYVSSLRAASYLASSGNIYTDSNYGYGLVGVYTSTRYQGVFAMGDSYKLPADGTTTGSLYGIAWSHPNAGGVAGNLNTHGALIMENGTFLAALSGSIRCRDDMRAPIYYDSNDTGYYSDPASTNRLNFVNSNNHYIQPGYMLYSDHGGWTGEYNKIQWHSSHLYLQNAGGGYLLILRRGDGGERFYCDYNGNVTASGSITAYSDASLKTNVKTITNARELRRRLRGVTFDWIESGQHSYGLIAQEVEKVIPELVLETQKGTVEGDDSTKIKSVDYSKLVSVLIQDGNEQDEHIEKLEARIARLEALIEKLI